MFVDIILSELQFTIVTNLRMSVTVNNITQLTYELVPRAVIHGIDPSDRVWPHVQKMSSKFHDQRGTTKESLVFHG